MRSRKLLAIILSLIAGPALAGYMTLLGAGVGGSIAPVVTYTAGTDSFPDTALSFSRPSLATMFDSTGKLTYAPNNLLPQSNTFSNAAWSKLSSSITTGQSDPFGGTAASKLVEAAATAQHYVAQNTGLGTFSGGGIFTVYAKAAERTKIYVWNDWTGQGVKFDLSNGNTISSSGATGGSTSLGNGWYQLYVKFPDGGTGNSSVSISSLDAAGSTSYTGDGTSGLYIYQATGSRVTYETTPRTADQVITTSAAYYGPRIDYDPNTLAVKGLLIEENRTWVALWNRDFTNAAWTKTSVTAALDQVGIDGVANSASSLTASANNGTVLQAITLASSQRATSAYVKRLVGSGAVSMTTDGGTTWTDITSQLGAGAYARATIPAQTVTNPSVGFKFATSGDKIAVDFFGNENGAFQTSPLVVASASVTRAADVVQFTGTALTALQGASGTAIVQTTDAPASPSASEALIGSNAVANMFMRYAPGPNISSLASDSTALNASGSPTFTSPIRTGVAWGPSSRSLVYNGGAVATDAKTFSGVTTAWLGVANDGAQYWLNGHIASFALYNSRLPDATLQARSVVGASYAANDNVNPFAPKFAANDNLPVHWRIAL